MLKPLKTQRVSTPDPKGVFGQGEKRSAPGSTLASPPTTRRHCPMKGASITLDWRFEVLRPFSKAHMQSLRDFHAHVKKYSEKAIGAWEQECEGVTGVTSRNGKNRTLRPIERRAGPELALFNLLVQPPAMVQSIVGKELIGWDMLELAFP